MDTATPDDVSVVTPDPASAAAPEPAKTTIQEAVSKGDVRTYREERHKQRQDLQQNRAPHLPAKQATATAVTPKPAASEPAAVEQKPRKNADTRIQELLRERTEREKAWERERSELLARVPKPTDVRPETPAKETTKAAWQRYKDLPDAPKLEQFETHEDYLDARADFIAEKKIEERFSARDQASRQEGELRQSVERYQSHEATFRESVLAWKAENPEAKFDDGFMAIEPLSAIQLRNSFLPPDQHTPIGPHHFVVEQVFQAEPKAKGPLCAYFSANPQAFADLVGLAMRDPQAVVRKVGQLEAQFLSTSASPVASPASRLSTVPAPATTLGRKAAGVSVDPMKRAIQSGDVRAYREMRRQERMAGGR